MNHAIRWLDRELDLARTVGDPLADELIASLNDDGVGLAMATLRGWRLNSAPVPASLPPAVGRFFEHCGDLPCWADAEKLDQAQRLYDRYAADFLAMLFYAALPECYAAADGVMVLLHTKGLVSAPLPRLINTARFVVDVMSPGAMTGEGRGIRSAQWVRWVHAMLRRQVAATRGWDSSKRVPINQEHMAGTLVAFSQVSLDALIKMGAEIDQPDLEAYVHAWSVVGHLLGIRDEYLPRSVADARSLVETIRQRNHRPSAEGRQLLTALLQFADSRFPPPARGLPAELVRYLVPETTADVLALPPTRRVRHLMPLLRFGFRVRDRVTRRFPAARALDFYNRRRFVEAVLWMERRAPSR